MSFFNGYSEFEYYKSLNKCYHLVDVDFDSDHKYRVMWKGTPTPLGELFNKKVKEYTSLDVVLSFFEIQTDAYLDFVLQIKNDIYGSLHSNYEIASYRDDSGDLPTVYFGDITAAIMKAFLESVEELKLPPIEDKLKSIRRINVRITNADQNITSKKSDKERKKYLKKGYNGLTNEELEPYKLSLVQKTLIFSEIDLESKLTPLGKAFNEKLKERTDMDIAFAEIYSANNQGIHLYLYDNSEKLSVCSRGGSMLESSRKKMLSPLCAQIWECFCESIAQMNLPPFPEADTGPILCVHFINYKKHLLFLFLEQNLKFIESKINEAFPDANISTRTRAACSCDFFILLKHYGMRERIEREYGKDALTNVFFDAFNSVAGAERFKDFLPIVKIVEGREAERLLNFEQYMR